MSRMTPDQERIVAGVDVGSTKVCCFIGRVAADGRLHLMGAGNRVSRGVRNGAIVDMAETEQAIGAAVDQAERAAGISIERVYVSMSGGQPISQIVEAEAAIDGHAVDEEDIVRVSQLAHDRVHLAAGRMVIYARPACFALDGSIGVRAPVGMYGDTLSMALHVISTQPGAIKNLEACVRAARLDIAGFVMDSHASGLACLVEDELELGVACIDIGGGSATLSVFAKGALVFVDSMPSGGQDVTEDLARELLTPTEHAERYKILYASALPSPPNSHDTISVPRLGEGNIEGDNFNHVPRALLSQIARRRMEVIFQELKTRLEKSGFQSVSGRSVVLTGGAAQMPGVPELAQSILGRQVRLGRPRGIEGLADAISGPAFTTAAGLLRFGCDDAGHRRFGERRRRDDAGGLTRVTRWLREAF